MHELSLEQQASLSSGASTWTSQPAGDIESMHMSDGPHGLRYQGSEGDSLGLGSSTPATCFPTASGMASTWDRNMIFAVGKALGEEARMLNVSMLLGPGINIRRSALGGRNFEYASEDPFLSGSYGSAFVKGVQSQGVSAVPKHFAVNNQETDRFRISAQVDERSLREIYLTAFEMTVKQARPWALMCSYNKVNGVYASENRELLTDILREEWGFDGVVVSDWGAVVNRVAALNAGLDIEMPPSNTDDQIVHAVESGDCSRETLDTLVSRVATLAERSKPSRSGDMQSLESCAQEHDAIAREAAQESVVMLKNDGILPLDPSGEGVIGVIGELARTPRYQGGGSSHVTPILLHNLLDELGKAMPQRRLDFAPAYSLQAGDHSTRDDLIAEAVSVAERSSAVIVNVGYAQSDESEGSDKHDIELGDDQQAVLRAVQGTGTPIILVIYGGGVIRLGQWAQSSSAIVEAWLPGQAGGAALADILTGKVSPSGKLTESIPLRLEDTPSYLHFPGSNGVVCYGEGLYVGYRYYDTANVDVAYPFGFGLSYTTFEYSNLKVEPRGACEADVHFTVSNTGRRKGAAVPQIYVRNGMPDRPKHELKGFDRIDLEAGESHDVTIHLDQRAFSVWDTRDHRWRAYEGNYTVELATSSRTIVDESTITIAGDGFVPPLEDMSTIEEWMASPYGAAVLSPLVNRIHDSVPDPSPEMTAMFNQMPLIKLASWNIGLDTAAVERMVAKANALRSAQQG